MPRVKKILTNEQQELYAELKKLSKRANQRIVRLERQFGKDTWATRYLKDKLESEKVQAWTLKGRVRLNKSMTTTQMKAAIKATNEFLNSIISTKTGIKKARKKAIEEVKKMYSTDISDITYQEAESLVNFYDDTECNDITNFIPGSSATGVIQEAREKNTDFETFESQMESIKKWNLNTSVKNILLKIFRKYIFSSSKIEEKISKAKNINDLDAIISELNSLLSTGIIEEKDYNYFIGLIDELKKEIEEYGEL